MDTLHGKTLFITGGSRGIGLAIALKVAAEGANIVIAAKTTEPNPKLPGTIYSAAAEIEAAGGNALPLAVDIRDDAQIAHAVQQTVTTFGGIDILVNNASAISLSGTLETPLKRYDLMQQVNARGTFAVSQACLPYLLQAANPHILMLSPPLAMHPKWFKDHLAYTMAKYGMSMCVLGMAEEFRGRVAVNALWPRTVILTAAMQMLGDRVQPAMCRKPDIVADAALAIFKQAAPTHTGNFYLDEDVLTQAGVTDFTHYAVNPGHALMTDLFLEEA
ncbi:MAG: short chain dehydrogenase [Thiothrix lacustris]|uniref:Short chain dehydrogenase n=1 Tax=Thiothrix lacustris TaxID=525917 RepID=A0A1Y1QFZ8_9GAMM|nr:MAG: short chain dehydrogenase [Thiothrix lacustris]